MNKFRNKIIKEKITFIKLPKTITNIPNAAFFCCYSLKEVIASEKLKTIGRNAFYDCTSLVRVSIPSSVNLIDVGAFFGCSSLKKFDFPDSLEIINEFSFEKCQFNEIKLPENLKKN